MPESFDSFSKNYNKVVNDAIRQTGYDAESLVSAKLQKIAQQIIGIDFGRLPL